MTQAAQLFAAADAVVLPYEVASQSGVLLLAYGFQRPVVVYPVGGLLEAVIDGETGWICARSDVEALRDDARRGRRRRLARVSPAGSSRGGARPGSLRLAGDRAQDQRALRRSASR